jgi:hypothetical protein
MLRVRSRTEISAPPQWVHTMAETSATAHSIHYLEVAAERAHRALRAFAWRRVFRAKGQVEGIGEPVDRRQG